MQIAANGTRKRGGPIATTGTFFFSSLRSSAQATKRGSKRKNGVGDSLMFLRRSDWRTRCREEANVSRTRLANERRPKRPKWPTRGRGLTPGRPITVEEASSLLPFLFFFSRCFALLPTSAFECLIGTAKFFSSTAKGANFRRNRNQTGAFFFVVVFGCRGNESTVGCTWFCVSRYDHGNRIDV